MARHQATAGNDSSLQEADGEGVRSAIETFSEVFPRLLLEAVRDPENADQLLLQSWDGRRTATTALVEHAGLIYTPKTLGPGLARCVRFPPPALRPESPAKLIPCLRDFLSSHAQLQPEVLDLLTAFVMATWFCDCLPVAPNLHLFGPDTVVSHVLRLLGCCCRRAILLGDVDFASLTTLSPGLGATLLINQRDLPRRIKRVLLASNRRHFRIARGKGTLDLYGAKAFSCSSVGCDTQAIRASLLPSKESLLFLTDAEEHAQASKLQASLLRYRLTHHLQVAHGKVGCSEFVPEMREQAAAWLLPILTFPELAKSVSAEILRQSQEAEGDRFFDPKCVVVEAALFFCHRPDTKQFLVGELAETANALLTGRHEHGDLSAKRVGAVLRELGIPGRRIAQGYTIDLKQGVRERIHELAYGYEVLSVSDGQRRCAQCRQTAETTH